MFADCELAAATGQGPRARGSRRLAAEPAGPLLDDLEETTGAEDTKRNSSSTVNDLIEGTEANVQRQEQLQQKPSLPSVSRNHVPSGTSLLYDFFSGSSGGRPRLGSASPLEERGNPWPGLADAPAAAAAASASGGSGPWTDARSVPVPTLNSAAGSGEFVVRNVPHEIMPHVHQSIPSAALYGQSADEDYGSGGSGGGSGGRGSVPIVYFSGAMYQSASPTTQRRTTGRRAGRDAAAADTTAKAVRADDDRTHGTSAAGPSYGTAAPGPGSESWACSVANVRDHDLASSMPAALYPTVSGSSQGQRARARPLDSSIDCAWDQSASASPSASGVTLSRPRPLESYGGSHSRSPDAVMYKDHVFVPGMYDNYMYGHARSSHERGTPRAGNGGDWAPRVASTGHMYGSNVSAARGHRTASYAIGLLVLMGLTMMVLVCIAMRGSGSVPPDPADVARTAALSALMDATAAGSSNSRNADRSHGVDRGDDGGSVGGAGGPASRYGTESTPLVTEYGDVVVHDSGQVRILPKAPTPDVALRAPSIFVRRHRTVDNNSPASASATVPSRSPWFSQLSSFFVAPGRPSGSAPSGPVPPPPPPPPAPSTPPIALDVDAVRSVIPKSHLIANGVGKTGGDGGGGGKSGGSGASSGSDGGAGDGGTSDGADETANLSFMETVLGGVLTLHHAAAAAALAAAAGGGSLASNSPELDWQGHMPLPSLPPPSPPPPEAVNQRLRAAAAAWGRQLDIPPIDDAYGLSDYGGGGSLGEGLGAAGCVPLVYGTANLIQLKALFNTTGSSRYIDIGSWRHSQPTELNRLARNPDPTTGLTDDAALFVISRFGRLELADGRPFRIAGLDAPHLMAWAGRGATRPLARELMTSAAQMGLNTIRFFAFSDGMTELLPGGSGGGVGLGSGGLSRPAVQVSPGTLDERALVDGFDWVVAAARRYGLRVIPVLTDGSSNRYGGMWQYINWINATDTVTSFYSNDTYKALFFDYMTALAIRNNSYTGMQHRHDPTILAWDLANRPRDPGNVGSEHLQNWLPYMAKFLRTMDPNHLIFAGLDGFFGRHSPHLLPYNPPAHVWAPAGGPKQLLAPFTSGGGGGGGDLSSRSWYWWGGSGSALGADPWDPLCEGVDFARNQMMHPLDLAAAHLAPDDWLLSGPKGRLHWAEGWVAAHILDALRAQKPLLLIINGGGPNVVPGTVGTAATSPIAAYTRRLLEQTFTALERADAAGLAVAGTLVSAPTLDWVPMPMTTADTTTVAAPGAAAAAGATSGGSGGDGTQAAGGSPPRRDSTVVKTPGRSSNSDGAGRRADGAGGGGGGGDGGGDGDSEVGVEIVSGGADGDAMKIKDGDAPKNGEGSNNGDGGGGGGGGDGGGSDGEDVGGTQRNLYHWPPERTGTPESGYFRIDHRSVRSDGRSAGSTGKASGDGRWEGGKLTHVQTVGDGPGENKASRNNLGGDGDSGGSGSGGATGSDSPERWSSGPSGADAPVHAGSVTVAGAGGGGGGSGGGTRSHVTGGDRRAGGRDSTGGDIPARSKDGTKGGGDEVDGDIPRTSTSTKDNTLGAPRAAAAAGILTTDPSVVHLMQQLEWRRFMNWESMARCAREQAVERLRAPNPPAAPAPTASEEGVGAKGVKGTETKVEERTAPKRAKSAAGPAGTGYGGGGGEGAEGRGEEGGGGGGGRSRSEESVRGAAAKGPPDKDGDSVSATSMAGKGTGRQAAAESPRNSDVGGIRPSKGRADIPSAIGGVTGGPGDGQQSPGRGNDGDGGGSGIDGDGGGSGNDGDGGGSNNNGDGTSDGDGVGNHGIAARRKAGAVMAAAGEAAAIMLLGGTGAAELLSRHAASLQWQGNRPTIAAVAREWRGQPVTLSLR